MQTPIICFSSFPVSFSQKIMVYTYLFALHCGSFIKSSELTKRNQKKMVLHIAAALPITRKRRFAQCIRCLHGMRERNLNLKRFSSKGWFFFFPDTTSSLVFMEIILCCTDGKKPSFSLIQDHTSIVKDHSYGLFQPMKAWPASFASSLSQLVQIIPVHHSRNIPQSSPEI